MATSVDLGASFASASTTSLTTTVNADTTFNFSSPNASGGNPVATSSPYQPANATATTAPGGVANSPGGSPGTSTGMSGTTIFLLAAAGFGLWWYLKHHKHHAAP